MFLLMIFAQAGLMLLSVYQIGDFGNEFIWNNNFVKVDGNIFYYDFLHSKRVSRIKDLFFFLIITTRYYHIMISFINLILRLFLLLSILAS